MAFLAKFHEIASEKGMHLYTWYWDPESKGIDDFLLEQTYRGGSLTWDNAEHIYDDVDNTGSGSKSIASGAVDMAPMVDGQVNQVFIPEVF